MADALVVSRKRLAAARSRREAATAEVEAARERLDDAAQAERVAAEVVARLEREAAERERAAAAAAAAAAARRIGKARVPAVPPRPTPRPAPGTGAPRRDPAVLARALAMTQGLLPDQVVARHGSAQRTVPLERGADYRVEPLNPRRRKGRGRVGRLIGWDDRARTGTMEWADGGVGPVVLADLIRLP